MTSTTLADLRAVAHNLDDDRITTRKVSRTLGPDQGSPKPEADGIYSITAVIISKAPMYNHLLNDLKGH